VRYVTSLVIYRLTKYVIEAMRFVQAPAFISEIAGARDRLVEKFRAADYEKWAKLLELTAQNQKGRYYVSLVLFSQT
jgi:hypothetical protein